MKTIVTVVLALLMMTGAHFSQQTRHRLPPPVKHSKMGYNKTSGAQAKRETSSSGVIWGPIIKLSQDAQGSGGNYVPHLAVQGDSIHCVWEMYGPNAFRLPYICSTNGGLSWEAPQELLEDSILFPSPHAWDAMIAIGDNLFIFFVGGDSNGITPVYFLRSTNRGNSWSYPATASDDTTGVLFSTSVRYDTMAVVYVPYIEGNPQYPRITRSINGGSAWTKNPFRMPSSSSNQLRVALTHGLLNFFHPGDMWPGPAPEIVLHRSADLADSWKDSLVLSPIDGNGSDMPEVASFEHPGTGDAGSRTTLGVMWRGEEFTGAFFSAGMALRLSHDNGMTWQPMQMVSDTPRGSFHALAIEGNKLAVAWQHELGDFGPFRIKARLSFDCGLSWDSIYYLTPFAENAEVPSVALNKSAIHVAWEEFIDNKWNIYYQRGELPKMTPSYSSTTLDLDTVTVGCVRSGVVVARNIRCDPLYLTTHVADEQDYSITPEIVIVAPHDSAALTIRYVPLSVGDKSTRVILMHNQGAYPDTILISAAAVGTGSEMAITDSFGIGWQMISVPVQPACPFTLSNSYFYQGQYIEVDTLLPGNGYWNKLNIAKLSFAGSEIAEDTIPVVMGWNLIGSISSAVSVSNIQSILGGVVTSNFYGYNGSNYVVVDSISPGRAYWVKVNQSGELILSSSTATIAANGITIVPTEELPPPPPGGALMNPQPRTPDRFLLEQNYPNPFNPVTNIEYRISNISFVSLRVFDVLGREVARLVNEVKQPGRYSVTWAPTHASSGIYFYRLTAGKFTETKKLLMLK